MQNNDRDEKALSQNVLNPTRKGMNYDSLHEEFVLWYALPTPEQIHMGIETQEAFAKYHGLSARTLIRWKNRSDFKPRIKELRNEWARSRTSNVILAIYNSAVKGNPYSQKLWLQYFEGFSDKTEQVQTRKVEITMNDIRFMIQCLPENLRAKHYDHFRELVDDTVAYGKAQYAEDYEQDNAETDELAKPLGIESSPIATTPTAVPFFRKNLRTSAIGSPYSDYPRASVQISD